jgi:acetyltransferase-like isoleucine patch superfamily enzyme
VTWWTRLTGQVDAARRDTVSRAVHWGWQEVRRAGEITAGTPAGRTFRRFGRGSLIAFPPGALFGQSGIEIGQDTVIGQQVSITAGMLPGQDLYQLTVLSIGDRCVIGLGSHLVAHESVTIGDDVWTGPYVYIIEHS